MTTATCPGRRLKIKAAETRFLKAQIHAYRVNLKHANEAMQRLEDDLAKLREERESVQFLKSPSDRIIADIRQNSNRPPQGRRYSLETLVWAQRIHDISPHAWGAVRKVLPFPSEQLLQSKCAETRGISDAVVDSSRIGELINPWKKARPPDVENCQVVLAFDEAAFRPVITIFEDGRVDDLKTMDRLDSSDLFS
jgi:hypothetical protein